MPPVVDGLWAHGHQQDVLVEGPVDILWAPDEVTEAPERHVAELCVSPCP